MSKVLCDVEEVATDSLPHCLRHFSSGSAAEDAINLVAFLKEVAYAATDAGDCAFQDGWRGFKLVLDLLQDKIEIASERYMFPTLGPKDAPMLVQRKE